MRAILLALFASLALSTGAFAIQEATPEPGLRYRVTGVAAGDVLNVRRQAGASEAVAATFGADARGIVVTGRRVEAGGAVWWEVVAPAGHGAVPDTGWANARFLTPETDAAETGFPLVCTGTEPFWSLAIGEGRADYSAPEAEASFEVGAWIAARGRLDRFAVRLDGEGGTGHAVIARQYGFCSDGMSDIQYPFDASVILPDDGLLAGCCARAAR